MKASTYIHASLAGVIALAGMATAAQAQETLPPTATPAPGWSPEPRATPTATPTAATTAAATAAADAGLADIVVTATKRNESLVKVPISAGFAVAP